MNHPICQSCAMPMREGPDFGTEADGSLSADYCRFCYSRGGFTNPLLKLPDMIDRLVGIGKERLGMTDEEARNIAESTLPGLKRWSV